MTENHPITPTLKLFRKWTEYRGTETEDQFWWRIATQATQWGADQQLAEDAKWLDHNALNEPHLRIIPMGESLKEAMRPKPPSLKEQALAALSEIEDRHAGPTIQEELIRRALEQLDD